MGFELEGRIEALDDKQAIYVTQKLSQALFSQVSPPALNVVATRLDEVGAKSGIANGIAKQPNLAAITLQAGDAGSVARAVLLAWAQVPALAPAVEDAVERYRTAKQDLGILSISIVLSLTYAALAMDLDLNLGRVKIKKAGLTGTQQAEIIKKTMAPFLKALGALVH